MIFGVAERLEEAEVFRVHMTQEVDDGVGYARSILREEEVGRALRRLRRQGGDAVSPIAQFGPLRIVGR